MAGEWRTLTVEDIKAPSDRSIAIGPFGSRMKSDAYVASGVPVIRGNNISDTRALVGDFVFVSDQMADELRACNVYAGDLVFPHRGAIGQVAIVPNDGIERYMLSTSLMKLTCDTQRVDPKFVFYFFRSARGQHALLQHASTVGTPGIGQPLTSLRSISVPVPPLPEQRAIAHILGTLDDKIELNRRMSETLEAMARALFRSWFVDFDPVRAKVEGRDPGLPRPLADLFPARLVDSDLGEIPEGWEVGPILAQARLLSGGTPKTDRPEYWDGPIPWASAKDVSQSAGSFLIGTERTITNRGLEESATQVVPALCTVVVAREATTGRLVLFGRDMAMNQTCYALAATTKTPFALYCRLREEIDALVHAAHGSVFDTITTSTFASSSVVLPARPVLSAFEEQIEPLFERVLRTQEESRTLADLRDALLPKLISSELRVKAAEQFLEGVGA
jgi:type I restriction enzyme S subunit